MALLKLKFLSIFGVETSIHTKRLVLPWGQGRVVYLDSMFRFENPFNPVSSTCTFVFHVFTDIDISQLLMSQYVSCFTTLSWKSYLPWQCVSVWAGRLIVHPASGTSCWYCYRCPSVPSLSVCKGCPSLLFYHRALSISWEKQPIRDESFV